MIVPVFLLPTPIKFKNHLFNTNKYSDKYNFEIELTLYADEIYSDSRIHQQGQRSTNNKYFPVLFIKLWGQLNNVKKVGLH